ncbi:hypothetical protein Taro_013316 [Colocasia esculenta]|uniref:Uncharacterized protein n=1 Tax=Colocasia esculenta TaxID=4460 RepID=A0A843UFL6_COLES|nr:hypothetical protein [Colocasia esculenta]
MKGTDTYSHEVPPRNHNHNCAHTRQEVDDDFVAIKILGQRQSIMPFTPVGVQTLDVKCECTQDKAQNPSAKEQDKLLK